MSPSVFDPASVRADFPFFSSNEGRDVAYLDNAATAQRPMSVIEAENRFYREYNSNIHRAVYRISERATEVYEAVRGKVRGFLGAAEDREIVFVRGATEAINLVASSFGEAMVRANDEIIVSEMEHHSNIVPWQLLCERAGAVLRVIPMSDQGELDLAAYERLLSPKTRIVAVAHQSNALGTVNDVKRIALLAHANKSRVLVDGAQSVAHRNVDVRDLDCDFYVLSGHKLFGPTGAGVLYGKAEVLESLPPYQGGGDMIRTVTMAKSTYKAIPGRFEAGTPAIAQVIALGAAIDYLDKLPWPEVREHERDLLEYATRSISAIEGATIYGTAKERDSILSFTLRQAHPHDIGTVMDSQNVCIRAGHHCAQPVMDHYGIPATARASFAFYNTREEVDRLVAAIKKTIEIFG